MVWIALLPVLAVATWVHVPNGLIFSNANGGWEYPVFLMIASVVRPWSATAPWRSSRARCRSHFAPCPGLRAAAMTRLTLISHHLCPFVQRAAIALAEKGVEFERIDVDLANKPDWFLAISPLGKVPLLKVSDLVISNPRSSWSISRRPRPIRCIRPIR